MDSTSKHDTANKLSTKLLWIVALGAMILAALPHFFLNSPLGFYEDQEVRAWLGLTIWAPCLLAATALFMETDLKGGFARPGVGPQVKAAAAILAPMVVAAILVHLNYVPVLWRPSDYTQTMLMIVGLYGFIHAVEGLFWQGFMQHRVLGALPAALRLPTMVVVGLLIWAPFGLSMGWQGVWETYLLDLAVIHLAAAALFELGVQTRYCVASRAAMGIAYAWAHQYAFV